MLVGIIGAPNKGKSTIFSALTMVDAEIADYAFTTIKPNLGVTYVSRECIEKEFKVKCKPKNSKCTNGIRQIPVNVIDVAGLVPGAHLGKGMGNQFLNDLIQADALIQVVDLSGETDLNGNKATNSDPSQEVLMIKEELVNWLTDIIFSHMTMLSKKSEGDKALELLLAGFKVTIEEIRNAANAASLTLVGINWNKDRTYRFAEELLKINKPIIIAANKLDKSNISELNKLKEKVNGINVVGCSGAIELALKKAAKNGLIDYIPGSNDFSIIKEITEEQKKALSYMKKYISENNGTGIQELLNTIVFKLLDNIIVYPVEDENKLTDHFGNILPDAILLKNGSTAYDLASKIHTEVAKQMRYAVDAKRKIRIQKEHALKDNDIIKIETG